MSTHKNSRRRSLKSRQRKQQRTKTRKLTVKTERSVNKALTAITESLYLRQPVRDWKASCTVNGKSLLRCLVCRQIICTVAQHRQVHDRERRRTGRRPNRRTLVHGLTHQDLIDTCEQGLVPVPFSAVTKLETALGWTSPKNSQVCSNNVTQLLNEVGAQRIGRVFCVSPSVASVMHNAFTPDEMVWVIRRMGWDRMFRAAIAAAADIDGVVPFVKAHYSAYLQEKASAT